MRNEVNPPAIVREVTDLASLGQRIKARHAECEELATLWKDGAKEIGAWLVQAKEQCLREGIPWTQWADAHTGIAERARQRYAKQFTESAGRTPDNCREPDTETPQREQPATDEAECSEEQPPPIRQVQPAAMPAAEESEPAEPVREREPVCPCCGAACSRCRPEVKPKPAAPQPATQAAGKKPSKQKGPCPICQRRGLRPSCPEKCWERYGPPSIRNGSA